jgi:hypothetical protein
MVGEFIAKFDIECTNSKNSQIWNFERSEKILEILYVYRSMRFFYHAVKFIFCQAILIFSVQYAQCSKVLGKK